jgi:hypothetical protein
MYCEYLCISYVILWAIYVDSKVDGYKSTEINYEKVYNTSFLIFLTKSL